MASEAKIYDLIGLGFGPSNLSMAVAIADDMETNGTENNIDMLFLEEKSDFAWHPGMLIKDTQMQISFLKDLITLKNPQSRFTFLNYIKEQGRLDEFINLREFYPTRIEFNGYLAWVAEQFKDKVEYGKTVMGVNPVENADGEVEYVEVSVADADGQVFVYRGKHIVVASGGIPTFPKGLEVPAHDNIFHSHHYLKNLEENFSKTDEPYRFVVIGGGQSSAEIFTNLISSYPNADVTVAMRAFAYRPADGSELVNELFFPSKVDFFYGLSEENREKFLRMHYNTNYAVVDNSLITSINKALYDQRVLGKDRFRIMNLHELNHMSTEGDTIVTEYRNVMTDEAVRLESDAVIMATGYLRPKQHPLLQGVDQYLIPTEEGGYQIEREYRLVTKENFKPSIFVQGYNESTHGLSDTLLSILPHRSSEILASLKQQIAAAEKVTV